MTEGHIATASSDHDLPEGWMLPRVGEILSVNYGKGLPETRRLPGKVPVYGSNGVIGYHSKPLTRGPTIVVGRKGTVGAVHFSQEPCWPIDTTYFIDQFNGLEASYVHHGLKYLNLAELDTSTAIPGLNRDELYDQRLPLAPRAEQKRIVAQIEELLARVNATRERLIRVLAILKRFRQAVLVSGVSGKLSDDWRQRAQRIDAKADLNAYLSRNTDKTKKSEEVQGDEELISLFPAVWANTTLGELFRFIDYRGKNPRKAITGKRLITAKNIRMGYVADEPKEFVSEEIYTKWMTRGFPRKGDIFFITEGHTMGFVAVNERDDDIALAQRTITLQPFSHLHTKFFFYVMMSEIFQRLVMLNATGSAAQGIKAARLRGLPVPFPSIIEQDEILHRIEALLSLADAIEKRLAGATRRVDSMAQEIVTRAFRGELVATEAELARREGRSYESAVELLSRIRVETESSMRLPHPKQAINGVFARNER